jgi:hypothetical protein
MSRSTFRTAAAACLAALSVAAVPAFAHASDDDSDPSPAGESCTTTDGEVLEDGEVRYEFQANGSALELQCNDGTLCGTTFYEEYPGIPKTYACESWGETLEHRNESRGARVLGVLVTTSVGTYGIRPVRVVSRARLAAAR